ncbi:MAG: enoyl-CoA hydratase/isomerase family protein [Sphingobium sp.]
MGYDYGAIRTDLDRGILTVTIDAPPCNILSVAILGDLDDLGRKAAMDDTVRVIVLQSADPDFFIAHFDVNAVLAMPRDDEPARTADLSPFHAMCARFRENPKPSLVKIAGRAGGGGCELASSCDMRFGVRGRTVLNQMEVPLGILPGGSGCQNLPRLLGRGRALEMILGADDIDAETAMAWGYLNRLFDTVDAMDAFVDGLARRIAGWPPRAVALAKTAVDRAELPWRHGLAEESHLALETLRRPEPWALMRGFLDRGGQTRAGERRVASLCVENAAAVLGEPAR